MKKLIFSLFALLISLSVSAQFSVTGSVVPLPNHNQSGVDVFVVNGINNTTELRYNLPFQTINWFRYENPNQSISNLNHIFPEAGGYIVNIVGTDGNLTQRFVWIFDYQEHLPYLSWFEPNKELSTCEKTVFSLNSGAVPPMVYYVFGDPDQTARHIIRNFTITYNTREYSNDLWSVVEKREQINFPTAEIKVPASLQANAIFTLSGDQFAESFGIHPKFSISTTELATANIESRLTAVVTTRDALNEINRPRERYVTPPEELIGSAPLEVNFQSRPSDDGAMVQWRIYRDDAAAPLVTRNDRDTRYTFSAYGRYTVRLSVTNGTCVHTDSLKVWVRESWLSVPNVFTPNNDGINDEFRVAFRSLESFHMSVFTDRGQLVFETTDPRRGWDGRIGNRNAPMGTYFYIIRARGTDGHVWNKRGDVALIR